MTAEVIVMNKAAVALAADSAVTSSAGKIFNSINKLFRLSDHCPVGVMIYGNAEIMGLPWESLIKLYKDARSTSSKKTIKDYGDDFIEFVKQQHSIFPEDERAGCVRRAILGYLHELAETADKFVTPGPKSDAEMQALVTHFTKYLHKHCKKLTGLPTNFRQTLLAKYKSKISEAIDTLFKQFALSAATKQAIRNYCIDCLSRENFANSSGVVIAGFGDEQLFPAYVEYEIEGFPLGDFLKYRLSKSKHIDFDSPAGIASFAQREMVQSFMNGIHPYVRQHLDAFLRTVLPQFEQAILKALGSKSGVNIAKFTKKLRKASKTIISSLSQSLESHRDEYHVAPVLDAVEMLPKDELAIMAESLVNLTVLKRRMSTDEESVGGPIDVAVISKADGFVWIKRKHYFTKALNPRYGMQYLSPSLTHQ